MIEPPRGAFYGIFKGAANFGACGHGIVDQIGVVAAQVNVPQPMALRKPARQSVALQQVTKRTASRHTVVAHRREDKNFVDRQLFGKEPVESYVGECATGETQMSRFVLSRSRAIERSIMISRTC